MQRKISLILGATTLAATVLAATLYFGPERGSAGDNSKSIKPGDPKLLGNFQPRKAKNGNPSASIDEYYYNYKNSKGQLIEVSGQHIKPLDGSLIQIVAPSIRIFLENWRVLEIQGRAGTIDAPGDKPQSGTLNGLVVVSLYESPHDRQPDLSRESADTALRMFMDEGAEFDVQLGRLHSAGTIHMTTPRADFIGSNLDMRYNDLHRRVERLEIAEGKLLRLSTARDKKKTDEPSEKSTEDQTPTDSDEAKKPKSPKKQKDTQFYRAKFSSGITIRREDFVLTGDQLNVFFAFDSVSDDDSKESAERKKPQAQKTTQSNIRFASNVEPVKRQKRTGWSATDRSLMTKAVDDVIVNWSGPMLVVPEPDPPADMIDGDDAMLVMIGSPIRASTGTNQTITAATIDYLRSDERVRLFASPSHPLTVDAPELGLLKAQQLDIDQANNMGTMWGPGHLLALRDKKDGERSGLTVQWQDRVDLAFHPKEKQPGADKEMLKGSPFGQLKTAVFREDVVIQHPMFVLDSDVLGLDIKRDGSTTLLQRVNAFGHVKVRSKSQYDEEKLDLDSKSLEIVMKKLDNGDTEPSRIYATGNVHARQPGRLVRAGVLDVELARQIKRQKQIKGADGKPKKINMLWYQLGKGIVDTAKKEPLKKPKPVDRSTTVELNNFSLASAPITVGRVANNVSGMTFCLDTNSLFMTVNNPPSIIEVSPDGETKRVILLRGFDDTEAIAHLGGKQFGIAEQRHSTVCVINIDDNTRYVDYSEAVIVHLEPDRKTRGELKSLSYDLMRRRFFAAKSKEPQKVYMFVKPVGKHDTPAIANPWNASAKSLNIKDITGLHFVSGKQTMLLLGGESQTIVECKPDGKEISRLRLPKAIGKPQGIALDNQGNMFVCGPPNLLYVFDKSGRNFSIDPEPVQPETPEKIEPKLTVRSLLATHNVRIEIEDENIRMRGDEVLADGDADQVVLYGTDQRPAEVYRDDGVLSGSHITIVRSTEHLSVNGPGRFQFVVDQSQTKSKENETEAKKKDKEDSSLINVAWKRSMTFNNQTGFGRFLGDVVATSDARAETSRLQANDLLLYLSRKLATGKEATATKATLEDSDVPVTGDRQLERMMAVGDVLLVNERWQYKVGGLLATRLRVTGPKLHFDRETELIKIAGAGTMLLQDERLKPPPTDEEKKKDAGEPAIKLRGRGKTLFVWTGDMKIDARHNDMFIHKGVQVIHEDMTTKDTMQIDCERFHADLADSGGLQLWTSGHRKQPKLLAALADGKGTMRVHVTSGTRTIQTDQLRYSGIDHSVLLKSNPGQMTFVQDGDNPPTTAERYTWDLNKNQIRIAKPGAGRAGVRQKP